MIPCRPRPACCAARDRPVRPKEIGRSTRLRPSLNREASRLGDVRVRRPSFRAQVPETDSEVLNPRKLVAMQYRATPNIAIYGGDHHRELVLARLQKAQCCRRAPNNPRQLAARSV